MFTLKDNRLTALLLTVLLTACGGGGSPVVPEGNGGGSGGGNGGGSSTPVDPTLPVSANTFYPMNYWLEGDGYVDDPFFSGIMFDPFIKGYVIAPVNANTLVPATSPSIKDYHVAVTVGDDKELIDPDEQGLMMQPVVGLPVQLNTALIIDNSASAAGSVDGQKLIAEIKKYLTAVKNHPNSIIKNQQFTLWSMDSVKSAWHTPAINEAHVKTFKAADAAELLTALDSIATDWRTDNRPSALYHAIVAAIGTYKGSGSAEFSEEVNFGADGNADLDDGFTYYTNHDLDPTLDPLVDPIRNLGLMAKNISSVVVFASGSQANTLPTFNASAAQAALNWQSLLVYDKEAQTEAPVEEGEEIPVTPTDGMKKVGKPLFYVVIGERAPDEKLKEMAAKTIETKSNTTFNFSSQLIQAQLDSLSIRTRTDNLYLVRFAFPGRDGSYQIDFFSNSAKNRFGLVTLLELKYDPVSPPPTFNRLEPVLEMAGPNNTYIAGTEISFAAVQKLYPTTLWAQHKGEFGVADYSWTVDGTSRPADADGAITLTDADVGKNVVLTNNVLNLSLTRSVAP